MENISELKKLIKSGMKHLYLPSYQRIGYDLSKSNASGMKPIHYAIENEKDEAFTLLYNHYEDLNIPDQTGMTPLHYAVAHENEQIIELLLEKNVDIDREDNEGETALDMATGQIKKLIEKHPNVKNR